MSDRKPSRLAAVFMDSSRAIIALIVALIVTFVMVLITSEEPLNAFNTFLTAPLGSARTRGL